MDIPDILVLTATKPICDFCGSPDIVVGYLIEDFVIPHFAWASYGGFAACAVCMRLIESGQRAVLEKRAYDSFIEKYGRMIPPELNRQFIHELHTEFWKRLRRGYESEPTISEVQKNTVH